jgi:hypothetical protein
MVRISFTLSGDAGAGNTAPELPVTRVIAIPSVTLPSTLQGGGGGNVNSGTLPPPRRP